MRRTLPPILALLLGVPAGFAATPRTDTVGGVDGWLALERDSVAVSSAGQILLGLAREDAGEMDALTVWDLLPDGDGVYVATGDGGALYRADRDGMRRVTAVADPEITTLGRDRDGTILLGTAPEGALFRLAGNEAEPVGDTPEDYVWDILADPRGGALVATGGSGRIYRLRGRDDLSLWVDPGVGHVTGLAWSGEDLLATTNSPGRLLRVTRDGTVHVLHEEPDAELRAPVVAEDAIYVLANDDGPGGLGRVLRRAASGAVETVWYSTAGFGYDLAADGSGRLWVAAGDTGGRGAVTRVEPGPPTGWVDFLRVPEPQVTRLVVDDAGPRWIGTGSLGKVYRIPGESAPRGRVLSEVLDAGAPARWGALRLEPGSTRGIRVETRSGNTASPDGSWSDWEGVPLTDGMGRIASPAGRYLRWRLELTGADTRVAGLAVVHLAANRTPRVNEIEVSPLGGPLAQGGERAFTPLTQELSGNLRVEFQTNNGGTPPEAGLPEAAWARRYRTVTWKAQDPDDDPLRYTVAFTPATEDEWRPLAEDLERGPWVWDSSSVPDGWYRIRVTADDAEGNPPGEGTRAARATEPFLVDNTPPRVENLALRGDVLTGRVRDATSPILAIEVSVDGGPWHPVFPEDGIADLPEETFRVPLEAGEAGTVRVVQVRAFDRAGNVGAARVRSDS